MPLRSAPDQHATEAAPTPAAPSGPLVRVRLTVAYDGSGFHGFEAHPDVRTVGGDLSVAIGRAVRLGGPVELACAGRTDRGVHALGQVVSFDVPAAGLDLVRLTRSINRRVSPDIAVRNAELVGPDFDARHSATARRYRYLVLNRPEPDPFLARTAWHVEAPLDLAAMTLACDPFMGLHDFGAFCRRNTNRDGSEATLDRRVLDASWHRDPAADGLLRFEIEAKAFCHQMVRSIVGTMVAVGRGKLRAGDVRSILVSRDRQRAGDLAPPEGLTLLLVRY